MPKKQAKIDRSKLAQGLLTESEYREIVYLPKSKGILPAPKPDRPNGKWEGDVWVADKPQTEFNLVSELANYEHSERRRQIWQAVIDGEVTPEILSEARERRLLTGQLPWNAIRAEAFAQRKGETLEGAKLGSKSEQMYAALDKAERAEFPGWHSAEAERSKDFTTVRRRRLQRLRDFL